MLLSNVSKYKYYISGHSPPSSPYLKTVPFNIQNNVSGAGFCPRSQVKSTQLGPVDRASPCLRMKTCTNEPWPQTFRMYLNASIFMKFQQRIQHEPNLK
jgi:hypothetical protein